MTSTSPCQLTCWTCCCCQESCPSQPHPSCSHCIMHHVPVIPLGFVACTCNVSVVLMQSLFLTISIAPLTWFCCHQSSAWHMLSVLVTPWRVNFFIHYLSVRVDHESCGSIQLKGLTYLYLSCIFLLVFLCLMFTYTIFDSYSTPMFTNLEPIRANTQYCKLNLFMIDKKNVFQLI